MTNPPFYSVSPMPAPAPVPVPPLTMNVDPFEQKRGLDFLRLWHAVVERIWLVVLCAVAGLFLALGYLAYTPKLYQGHTVLEVQVQEPTLVESERASARVSSTFLQSDEAMHTIEQNLINRSLLARVIRAEGFGREYIRSSIERRISLSQDSLRYLLEEEERLKRNLQKSEVAVAEYKENTPDALQLGGGAAATGSQTGAGAGSGGSRGGLV